MMENAILYQSVSQSVSQSVGDCPAYFVEPFFANPIKTFRLFHVRIRTPCAWDGLFMLL